LTQNRLEVGAHLAKNRSNLGDFPVRRAVWKLAGGGTDGSVPLNRPGGRDRTLLTRPPPRMLPSFVRASRVKGRKGRAVVSEGELLAVGCGPSCSAPILNQIFIPTMIGS